MAISEAEVDFSGSRGRPNVEKCVEIAGDILEQVAYSEAHAVSAGHSDERGSAKAHPADERLEAREIDRRARP
jgi:hypothetical protein